MSSLTPTTTTTTNTNATTASQPHTYLELIPSSKVGAAGELSVYDARGNHIKFGALFELEMTIVVFIRHFFCGNCQEYVTKLSTVRPEALEQAGTKIVIIGCGDWQLINNYRQLTSSTPNEYISFYADPTRTLYRALGVTTESLAKTPKDGSRRSYITMSMWQNTTRSILRAMKNPLHLGRQGNISQLGGEFILGPNNTCWFAHYMSHTQDHEEVAELLHEAGVAFP